MKTGLPTGALSGPVLVLAPHFDDEILGCGGLLAGLVDKAGVRVVFACDGRGSAELPKPGKKDATDDPPPFKRLTDIRDIRTAESAAALALLGIPATAIRRLDFPDGSLASRGPELQKALEGIVAELKPAWILAPFRFDRHPDHIALSRAALALTDVREGRANLLEYFVYFRFRFFPDGDIRRVIRPEFLVRLELEGGSFLKRRALDCFTTQTTPYFSWQTRSPLSEALLREVAAGPERYLAAPPGAADGKILRWPAWVVRLLVTLEYRLKRAAYVWRLKRRLKGNRLYG